jgi:sorbitol-6-phosphate 2-dehydrogenase
MLVVTDLYPEDGGIMKFKFRRFEGQVAIITGAASGLGAAIAQRFAQEGAQTVLCDLNREGMEMVVSDKEFSCSESQIEVCDVSASDQVTEMIGRALDSFGKIDILVNNAGVNRVHPLVEFPEEDWDFILSVNLKSMFILCKAVGSAMMARRYGKIINISSKSGGIRGSVNAVGYTASKAGVIGLTQTVALELAPFNINVNAVCPGVIFTPMWEKIAVDYARKNRIAPDEVQDFYKKKIPLGRLQTCESIAGVVAFLASEEARDITGQQINVTGGQ